MLGQLAAADEITVADLEAGIGTMTRLHLHDAHVDVVVVVVEPTAKSLQVGERLIGLVRDRGLGQVVVVANRVRDDDDLALIRAALPGEKLVPVPEDPAVIDADRRGVAPLDAAPDSPAVTALAGLATDLLAQAS